MATKKRIFGWLTVSFVAVLLLLYFVGPRVFWVWQARKMVRDVPIAGAMPRDLPTFAANPSRGSLVAVSHYEFEVPWSDLDRARMKTIGAMSVVPFLSSTTLIVATPKWNDAVSQTGKDAVANIVKCVRGVYGPAATQSDLAFWSAVYSTNPRDITFFTNPDRATLLGMILMAKAVAPPTDDPTIFRLHYGGFQGFQLGNPDHHLTTAQILVYDSNGGIEITISHRTQPEVMGEFSQADMNRIITTLRHTDKKLAMVEVTTQ